VDAAADEARSIKPARKSPNAEEAGGGTADAPMTLNPSPTQPLSHLDSIHHDPDILLLMIKTSKVIDRRTLRFGRMEDILKDVEALDAAQRNGGKIVATGNWTPAQIVWHVNAFIIASMDGFSFRAPLPFRILGKLIKNSALNKPLKPGIKAVGSMKVMMPPADVKWDDAVTSLRKHIGRIAKGEKMRVPSPMFGELAHEEWIQLHCRHAEMHFGFMKAG